MKKLAAAIGASLLLGQVTLSGTNARDDSGPQKHPKHHRAAVRDAERTSVDVHVTFSTRDVRIIREYYGPRYRKLPKGLQKKLARTGTLPPGWQKKMEPFPVALERDLVVLPRGYRRGVLDGNAVIYQPRSQVIIDVAVLF